MKKFSLLLLIAFCFISCNKKPEQLYNKPALSWYRIIANDIRNQDLDSADTHYTSMSSEHPNSPLLEPTLLILAQAHMRDEEYILADFYLEQYIKRYGNSKSIEYAQFLKIKSKFLSFKYPNRNQELILSSIDEIKNYLKNYPNNAYTPMIESMLVKFELANYELNQRILKLYNRLDYNESANIYKEELQANPLKDAKIIPPQTPWYLKIF